MHILLIMPWWVFVITSIASLYTTYWVVKECNREVVTQKARYNRDAELWEGTVATVGVAQARIIWLASENVSLD